MLLESLQELLLEFFARIIKFIVRVIVTGIVKVAVVSVIIRVTDRVIICCSSTEAGIGFLDICGFENLGMNSLEQLCINLANEHLQKFMNSQVFEHEMNVYRQEGVDLGHIDPPSNEAILQMFDEVRETGEGGRERR